MNYSTSYEIQNFSGYAIKIQEQSDEKVKKNYDVANKGKIRYFYNLNQEDIENDLSEVCVIQNVKCFK
jgi:hypothetical protein